MKELKDLKSQMQLKDAELLKKETALIEHIKLKEGELRCKIIIPHLCLAYAHDGYSS